MGELYIDLYLNKVLKISVTTSEKQTKPKHKNIHCITNVYMQLFAFSLCEFLKINF